MTTITNTTGSKKVTIRPNISSFIAQYVQVYNGEEQVLQSKSFSTEAGAKKWAEKVL